MSVGMSKALAVVPSLPVVQPVVIVVPLVPLMLRVAVASPLLALLLMLGRDLVRYLVRDLVLC